MTRDTYWRLIDDARNTFSATHCKVPGEIVAYDFMVLLEVTVQLSFTFLTFSPQVPNSLAASLNFRQCDLAPLRFSSSTCKYKV